MTHTPRKPQPYKARKQITLSPEALAALKLPLEVNGSAIFRADDRELLTVFIIGGAYTVECELAAFIAALVNEALTPAPAQDRNCHARAECEIDCPWADHCDNAAATPANETCPGQSESVAAASASGAA